MRSISMSIAALLLLLSIACIQACQNKNKLAATEKKDAVSSPEPITLDKGLISSNEANNQLDNSSADTVRGNQNQFETPQTAGQVTGTSAGRNAAGTPGKAGQFPAPQSANPDWDKKIVKTANINLEVKNFKTFNDLMHKSMRQNGAYISQEEQTESTYKIENTITIKVPVFAFDDVVMQLASDSDKLVEKKISSEDVTMQVIDAKSRLETKRAVRLRYMDLLKQAKNPDDMLKVQGEIDEIQEQLEAASGRIAYLGHSASFSTINLHFYQVLDAGAKVDEEPTFLHKIKESFGNGWKWISDVLIGLIALWPLWIAGLAGWMAIRRWRMEAKRKRVMPS